MATKAAEFDVVIDNHRLQKEYVKDLYRYRELFYFFAWRDILVRYRHTVLGVLWVLLRPLINMSVFAFVFGKVANLDTGIVNYPLFVLAALLPWQLFASCLVEASFSLVNNGPMISKIYFPRMILPVSHILVNFIDFSISLILLLGVALWIGAVSLSTVVYLPFFVLLSLLLCLGTSLWIAAINVRFSDFRILVPFVIQFGMFISPVGYSSFLVPEPWRYLYFINPMAGIIEGFRWCCFGIYHPDLPIAVLISCGITFFLAAAGFQFFRRMERVLADII